MTHLAASSAIRIDVSLLWLLLVALSSSSASASASAFVVVRHRRPPTIHPPLSTTSSTAAVAYDDDYDVRVRDARYSDLPGAARLIADAFFGEEMRHNPLMRLARPLLELDRLQSAFPYDDYDDVDGGGSGRHSYLVVREVGGDDDDDDDDDERGEVVGFCDVDGRERRGAAPPPSSSSSSFPLPSFFPWSSAIVQLRRPLPYFSDLVVRADVRRRGIASRLLDEAERRARDMGYDDMYLCIRRSDGVALGMYVGRGYEIVNTPVDDDMAAFLEAQDGLIMLRRSLR